MSIINTMPELLPLIITPTTHPVAIRLAQPYRPHTPIPSRQELLSNRYEISGHCSLKSLCNQMGVDYHQEIKKRQ